MALFGKEKQDLQVSLSPRKKKLTPLPALAPLEPKRKLFKDWKKTLFGLILLAVFAALAFFFAGTLRVLSERLMVHSHVENSTTETSGTPLEIIVREVGKQYLLPSGETPTLAMVTNLEELKGQPFFAKAKVGDAVLMYLEAKKAILWRPSTSQIVEIGPLTVVEPNSSSTQTEVGL